ncbi:MAG: hypothetical protein HQK55_09505 [Deltaproteobacteria bacterium]|nr:hypothetical protein [Deltaproteobacteria bacterium]
MTDGLVHIDQWVTETAGILRGKDRQKYLYFQNAWTQGHISNPMLFPLRQSPAVWKEHYEWFQLVDGFQPQDQETFKGQAEKTPSPTDVAKPPLPTPKSESQPRATPPAPPPAAQPKTPKPAAEESLGDLDDLGTLIMEHQTESQPTPQAAVRQEKPKGESKPPAATQPLAQALAAEEEKVISKTPVATPKAAPSTPGATVAVTTKTSSKEDKSKSTAPAKVQPQAPTEASPGKNSDELDLDLDDLDKLL